jgi:hypothetical protein
MTTLQIIIELGGEGAGDVGPPYGVGRANRYHSAGDQIRTFLGRYRDAPSLASILGRLTDDELKTPETLDRVLRKLARDGHWTPSLKGILRG